jgi:hypothetical protein
MKKSKTHLIETMSWYICLSSCLVVCSVYGGGSSSYVSKLSSESLTVKGLSSSYKRHSIAMSVSVALAIEEKRFLLTAGMSSAWDEAASVVTDLWLKMAVGALSGW